MRNLYAEFVDLPFSTRQEKEDFIIDTAEEIIPENEDEEEYFIYSCTHCKEKYTDLEEAVGCCYDDCNEQLDEWAKNRDSFSEHWA